MAKTAIIAGASGLIGSNLLQILTNEPVYEQVLLLLRKELPIKHRKIKQLIVNFNQLAEYKSEILGDVIFCCLGSTRKKTPDLTKYRKIDHDYPVQLASIALENGISQYHLVSSIGANAASSNFYTKMKGETEADIIKVGLPSLHIYQPSALAGDRKESRPLEKFTIGLMKIFNPLLIGSLKKYRSIKAATVASAMCKQSLKNLEGLFIYPSDQIQELS